MEVKIYLKQLLKNAFTVKRYRKGLLVQIKWKLKKIITNKACTEEEDGPFKKYNPIRSLIHSEGQYTVEI